MSRITNVSHIDGDSTNIPRYNSPNIFIDLVNYDIIFMTAELNPYCALQ